MVFGDGKMFDRFTKSLDVIGHELTHGVTEHEAGLQYLNQSGALNESVSDVFGSLVKQYKLGQAADQADWLIGADLVKPGFPGKALRSMAEPGTAWDGDNQPAHMDGYVQTMSDNGGVHTNSGIPNKAFAELSPGARRAGVGEGRAHLVRDAARPAGAHERDLPRVRGAHARRPRGSSTAPAATRSTPSRAAWDGVGVSVALMRARSGSSSSAAAATRTSRCARRSRPTRSTRRSARRSTR